MQFRMSPGGMTPRSSRKRPELPPSSVTVTITERSAGQFLSPRSRVERPVPPPMETILGTMDFNTLLFRRRYQISECDILGQCTEIIILRRLKSILRPVVNRLLQIRDRLVPVS